MGRDLAAMDADATTHHRRGTGGRCRRAACVAALVVGTVAAWAGGAPGAGASTVLFAAPVAAGTGDCSSQADACTLATALSDATSGAVVELTTAGQQADTATWYSGTFTVTTSLTIEPVSGVDDPILDGGGAGSVITISGTPTVTIEDVTIQDGNTDGSGGGIDNSAGGTVSVVDDTVSDDTAFTSGGGIENDGGGTLDVTGTTFTDDTTTNTGNPSGFGGAIDNGYYGSGTATVKQSTFVDDSSTGDGGAITNGVQYGFGTMTVTGSTFEGNRAGTGPRGGSGASIVNGSHRGSGVMTVAADVFADSGACSFGDPTNPPHTWNDDGYNVGEDTSCFNGAGTDDDSAGTDLPALLGSLAANGGPTDTVMPQTGNPALGIVPASTSGLCPVTDQRGYASPSGTACDAGAVQHDGLETQTVQFTTAAPTDAVAGASTYTPAATSTSGLAVTITLDASSTGCSLTGGVVSFTAAGTCVLDANQAGDDTVAAAPQVQQSFTVAASPVQVASPPGAPTSVVATADPATPGAVSLWWTPPASGGAPTGYTVTPVDLTTGDAGASESTGAGATSVTLDGLAPGDLYDVTVVAVDPAGPGPAATSNQVVPVAVPPTGTEAGTSSTSAGVAFAAVGPSGQAGSLSATASGPGTVTVARYPSDPMPDGPAAGSYFDVAVAPGATFSQLSLDVCGVAAGAQVQWWDPQASPPAYRPVSDQGVPTGPGDCVVVTIDASTSPSLAQLVGTVLRVAPAGSTDALRTVGADGGVFAFGDAAFEGSLPSVGVRVGDVVGMAATADGGGYWLVGADGGIFAFGDAPYPGSPAVPPPAAPVVGAS